MTITKTNENGVLTYKIEGRINTLTASELEEAIFDIDKVKDLVFDFKNLEYISSAGLRILLKVEKTMAHKGSFKVINVNDAVYEVFEITGFTDILKIER